MKSVCVRPDPTEYRLERSKTGDIIQGLPRIEELLEARKPKEACVLARKPGVCQVEYQDSEIVDIKVVEDDGTISEYPLLGSQNPLVSDNQRSVNRWSG